MRKGYKIVISNFFEDDCMILVDNCHKENKIFMFPVNNEKNLMDLKNNDSIGVWKIKQLKN